MTLRVVHNEADAEDLIQDAHLKAFVKLDQFEGRSSFATWLATIAVHGALSQAQRLPSRLARSGALTTLDESDPLVADGTPDPEQQVLDVEARRVLRHAILALPPVYRTVVILRAVRELTTAETARTLHISPQTVKTRLYRAKALLRAELAPRLFANRAFAGDGQERAVSAHA